MNQPDAMATSPSSPSSPVSRNGPGAGHAPAATATAPVPVRVWDLPTRLFHWLLVLCIVGLIVTGKIGGGAMVWHMRLGLCVMGLLLFRLMWGLVGGRWSRFASFIYMPGTVLRFLRKESRPDEHHEVGHNPLGSLSVLAMLAVLIVQVCTGLVADDEIANVGPLNRFVSTANGLLATGWHKTWGQWAIFALIGTHIAAIVAYLVVKKTNLIRPMVVGDKQLPPAVPAAVDNARSRLLALVLALVAFALVGYVSRLGG
jgi:cytochrome b